VVPLNEYEARQADEIAAWKSERPSLVMAAFRGVGRPLSRFLARVVPDETLRTLANKAEELSTRYAAPHEIARQVGVKDLSELGRWTLAECDALAATISAPTERRALAEGAVAGLGGIVTETLNLPILLAATLRSIFRIGHCYGFPLESEIDRLFVLGILELSTADEPARRQAVCQQLRKLDGDRTPSASNGQPIHLDGLEESLLLDMAIGAVPLVGDLTWILMDYDFIRRVDITARRVFQERWLRLRGKVTEIDPAHLSLRRSSVEGAVDLAAQLSYAACYGLAFGVTIPLALTARGIALFDNPVARGARKGAEHATRDADRVLAKLHARGATPQAGSASTERQPPGLSPFPTG
jgi:EcsC protein family